MFNLTEVRRKSGKRKVTPPDNIFDFNPFTERKLPFYSVVPENRQARDERWKLLTRQERGDFLQLVDWLWVGGGAIRVSDAADVAANIGIPPGEFEALIRRLVEVGYLVEHSGRLVQPELRTQYLATLHANQNRTRGVDANQWEPSSPHPLEET